MRHMYRRYAFTGFDLIVLPSGEAHLDIKRRPVFNKAFLRAVLELKHTYGKLFTKRPIVDAKTDTFNRRLGLKPVKYDLLFVYYEWR